MGIPGCAVRREICYPGTCTGQEFPKYSFRNKRTRRWSNGDQIEKSQVSNYSNSHFTSIINRALREQSTGKIKKTIRNITQEEAGKEALCHRAVNQVWHTPQFWALSSPTLSDEPSSPDGEGSCCSFLGKAPRPRWTSARILQIPCLTKMDVLT